MMRRLIPAAAALALLAMHAQAQTQPAATPAPAATSATPATTAPATTSKTLHHRYTHRRTLQQRFDAANTTHDGHLTKDQAAAANWSYVTNHFAAIDKDKRGYVTVSEIHAYAHAQYVKYHHKPKPAAPAAAPASSTSG